jgi:hypothetical protein
MPTYDLFMFSTKTGREVHIAIAMTKDMAEILANMVSLHLETDCRVEHKGITIFEVNRTRRALERYTPAN